MDAPTPVTPPGWYDDGHGSWRWWDGERWTEHTAPKGQAPATPAPQTAAAQPPARELVTAPRSKLVWLLPVALVICALIGVGGALALGSAMSFDSTPLKQTYADYMRAERDKDCATLQRVTTTEFRDDLVEPRFDCTTWQSLRPEWTDGKARWAMSFGRDGILVAEERTSDGDTVGSRLVTYSLVKRDGRWLLSDSDD